MAETTKLKSTPGAIAAFLAIAFATSWVLWGVGIRAKVREDLLVFGVAGPAFAAAVMRIRSKGSSRFATPLFLAMAPIGWASLVMAAWAGARFHTFSWNPILIVPALVPALTTAYFFCAGEIRIPSVRWPFIAALSMPVFLLVPAGIAYWTHLPVVQPRSNEGMTATIGAAAILFAKQFLFAGLLELPGWRGWLLPRLQQRFSPLVASVFVWLPWALWHAPLDFSGGVGRTWMNYVQVRVVFFIAITILLTWFYNRSRGSIVVTALFHAGFNTFPFVLPYSPPFLALIFGWAIWVVFADGSPRRPLSYSSVEKDSITDPKSSPSVRFRAATFIIHDPQQQAVKGFPTLPAEVEAIAGCWPNPKKTPPRHPKQKTLLCKMPN